MAIDAGIVSAYGFAVAHGYTGTPEQFGEDQANFAANAQQVREDKETVEELVESIPPDYTTMVEAVDDITEATSQNGNFIISPGTGTSSAILNVTSGSNANTASGDYSYAEGFHTSAAGANSHAEGDRSTASGESSHAEGTSTTASGRISHAEGLGTIANHVAQRASGAYNVADPSTAAATAKGNYIEIVGNGTSNSNRSNARTLDWSGNEVLAGNLTASGGSITVGQTTFTENQLSGGVAAPAMIAPAYSATNTYAVGDYVTYNDALYCCKTAITTAEAWTASHWEAAKVGPDLKDLKSSIDDFIDTVETQTLITATEVNGIYINGKTTSSLQRYGTGGASLIVYYIPVEIGKSYRLNATNLKTLSDDYGFIAFSTDIPAPSVNCTVLMNGSTTKVDSISFDYTPLSNGYLGIVKGVESSMTYAFYLIGEKTYIVTDKTLTIEDMPADAKETGDRFNLLGYTTESEKSDVISDAHIVADRYITESGRISTAGSNNFSVAWYPVIKGNSYSITGLASVGGNGQALVCFDNEFNSDNGHYCKEVLQTATTTPTEYDISYTPIENGYIVMPKIDRNQLVVTLVSDTDFQRVYDLEKAIDDIEAEIGRTKIAVKIQLFGDSITDNLWGDTQTWANFIQQNLSDYNVTVVNDAVGGSGIGHGKSSGTTPSHQEDEYNHVYDLVTDGTTLQTDANYVVILAGTNNWASGTDLGTMSSTGYSTVYGALKGILEYISTHSSATVFVCTIPQRYNSVDAERDTNSYGEPLNPDNVSLADYCEAFRKVSAFYGMPCIHLNEDLGWNRLNISNFSSDGLHPNTYGDKMLSAFICSEIHKHIGKVSYT